jgi:DNA-binding CsgD family transcriptional regulator
MFQTLSFASTLLFLGVYMVYLSAPPTKPRHLKLVKSAPPAESFSQVQLLQAVIEGFMDGIMIVSAQGEILEANSRAREICQHLAPNAPSLPCEIWQVCEALISSQGLYPGQRVIPESILEGVIDLRIRVRWLNQPGDSETPFQGFPCMIVTLEDRQQTIHNLAIADTQKYDLTPREAEIWQMRLEGQSYQAIASQLYITQNTVKKHVKNILAKRRDEF